MARRPHYGPDHLEDLRALIARGHSISEAARMLGMARSTAHALLGSATKRCRR